MKYRFRFLALSLAFLAVGSLIFTSFRRPTVQAEESSSNQQAASTQRQAPIVGRAVDFYRTRALRDLPPDRPVQDTGRINPGGSEREARIIPNPERNRPVTGPGRGDGALLGPNELNRAATPADAPAPAGVNVEGLSSDDNVTLFGGRVLPPDTIGDVGPTQYVQAVNLAFRVFDKSGAPLTPPRKVTILFNPNTACGQNDDGDPTVNYDPLADRWVITQFAIPGGGGQNFQCIAVSQTGDATGAYYSYQFATPGPVGNLGDYPKFGIWPDAYYMTTNQFAPSFIGAAVFAFDREKMLAGDPTASYVAFNTEDIFPGQGLGSLLPSTLDNSQQPPPPGRPNTFIDFIADEFGSPFDGLRLFDFRVDFDNPSASTFTERPESPITVAPFDPRTPPGRNDVEQPPPAATNQYLDTIGDRVMHRLQYRNFGSGVAPIEALVVNQTVNAGPGTSVSTHQAAPRYYQLENTGSGFTVRNQGTFIPEGVEPTANAANNRWMGSVALDNDGNLALGYSVSSRTVFPSIGVTGRLLGDPPNTLQPEVPLVIGGGIQLSTSGRWGDYSSMNVDPVDDCTFWYTQEYYATTSAAGWRTRIGNFRFPSCTTPAQGTLRINVTDCGTGQPIQGASVTIDNNLYGTTLASGAFQTQLGVGTYTVVVTAPGGATFTRPVTITNGSTTTINECFGGQPTDPVVVTLSRDASGNLVATVRLTNPTTQTINNVVVTQIRASTLDESQFVDGVPVPQSFGSVAPGQTVTAVVTFPGTSGVPPGFTGLVRVVGTFNGGSFNVTRQVVTP